MSASGTGLDDDDYNTEPDSPDKKPQSPVSPLVAALLSEGCHLTPEGIETVGLVEDDTKNVLQKVLDFDLREIGAPAFPEDFCKSGSKCETLEECIFVQIQKVRNISAPKTNEESKHSPRMLKLTLSDGHTTCQAIEVEFIPSLNVNTPPGTKIQIKSGPITTSHGYLFIGPQSIKVVGGRVSHMIEKWELNRSLAKHTRVCVGGEGAPPPWIPFGQPLEGRDLQDEMFKVLQDSVKMCNAEFEAQRKGAIAEAQKLSGTKKIFGGGTKPMLDANVQKIVDAGFTEEQAENALKINRYNADKALKYLQRGTGENKKERSAKQTGESKKGRKSRDKDANDEDGVGSLKPTGKLSLFDFLEDKLPITSEPEKPVKFNENPLHKEEHKFDKSNERKNQNKSSGRGGRSGTNRSQPTQQTNHNNKYDNMVQNHSHWQNENQRNYSYSREDRPQYSYNSQQMQNEKPPRFQRKQENEAKKHQNFNMGQETSYQQNYQQMQQNYYPDRRNIPDNRNMRGYYNQPQMDALSNATAAMNLDSQNRFNNYRQNSIPNYQNNYSYPAKNSYNNTGFQNDVYKRNNQYQNNKNQMPNMSNGQSLNQSFYNQYGDNQMKRNESNSEQPDILDVLQQQNNQVHDQRNNFNYRGNGFYQTSNIVGFQNAAINEQARKMLAEGTEINWSVGDRCLAKYWEDNVYYDAEITGVSAKTVVVRFLAYGNHEEVLRSDCLPPNGNVNRPGFGRDAGMNRNENSSRPGRFHQPMYVPPAQRKA